MKISNLQTINILLSIFLVAAYFIPVTPDYGVSVPRTMAGVLTFLLLQQTLPDKLISLASLKMLIGYVTYIGLIGVPIIYLLFPITKDAKFIRISFAAYVIAFLPIAFTIIVDLFIGRGEVQNNSFYYIYILVYFAFGYFLYKEFLSFKTRQKI